MSASNSTTSAKSFPVEHGRSLAALIGIGVGIASGPAIGGATFALCVWQAKRARLHPGMAPGVVATSGVLGPAGVAPLRVTWLGDSLAAGLGADHVDETPARLVARMLDRPVDLRILAVSGAKSSDVLADQVPALSGDEDLVVVCVGSNDVASRTKRRDYSRQLDAVLDATAHAPTLVLSLPDISMADRIARPLRWFAGLRARYFEAARERVVGSHAHVASVDIASRPPEISRASGRELLCADRFHPGSQVYRLWAERIAEAGRHLLTAPEPALLPVPVPRSRA